MDYTVVIDRIATLLPIERKEVVLVIDTLIAVIRDRAILSESITIPLLGKFHPHKQLEKVIVRPDTGQSYLLPPKITIRFHAFSRPSRHTDDLDINTVLPYPSFVTLLEKRGGVSQTVVESVIYRLTQLILEQDQLHIDRFGSFRWISLLESQERALLFIPERNFLQDINSPFSCFSILPLEEEKSQKEPKKESQSEEFKLELLVEEPPNSGACEKKKQGRVSRPSKTFSPPYKILLGIIFSLILLISFTVIYTYNNPIYWNDVLQSLDLNANDLSPEKIEQLEPELDNFNDTLQLEKDQQLSLPEVTYLALDTIELKAGSRLTLLAQKYYKERNYWIYIYLENQKANPNPNNIPQGTVLVIPDLKKYGVEQLDSASVQKAKELAQELLF